MGKLMWMTQVIAGWELFVLCQIKYKNMNLVSIILLLQTALSLLSSPNLQSNPQLQAQALSFANQAIAIASSSLSQQSEQIAGQTPTTPITIIISTPTPTPTSTPTPIPTLTPTPTPVIISMESLKIISPIPSKGLGRTYVASPEVINDSNYIELGLVVRNNNGESIKNVLVVIESTDASQNKNLEGTGNITTIYNNGIPETVYYYPYHYEFKTSGVHEITFKSNGMIEMVSVNVL